MHVAPQVLDLAAVTSASQNFHAFASWDCPKKGYRFSEQNFAIISCDHIDCRARRKVLLRGRNDLSPYYVAQTHALLDNRSEALKYLAICVQSHDELVLSLSLDQDFARLHGDPAFQQLLARIGLPPVN